MKKLFIILLIVVSASSAALYVLYKNGQIKNLSSLKHTILVKAKRSMPVEKFTQDSVKNAVTLYLKNGSAISGELVEETRDGYLMNWQGGEVIFYFGEVERLERGKKVEDTEGLLFETDIPERWPYNNDVAIMLTNGTVMDAEITDVSTDKISIGYALEEGGSIEQDIERSKVEYLIFKPVDDNRSEKTREDLKKLFSDMEFYDEGNFTIVTDSYITWVREYRSTLRQAYTDIYLTFFDLFKDEKPDYQNFVVIFDEYRNFAEYAVADGVPAWAVLGYFRPDDRILYLFNTLGDRFSDYMFDIMVGSKTKMIDEHTEKLKEYYRGKHEIAIDGMAKEIKDKFWKYYNLVKGDLREQTMATLRHEFTHELFNNWGLQNIIVSRVKGPKDKLVEKKREYLDTQDNAKKRAILIDLMTMRSRQKIPEMQAANSWLSEGIATFCETYPPGSQNNRWLYVFQKMKREDAVYPLEYLTVYKIGSFPGVYHEAMLYAYAQSWAFVKFLMDRYPAQFVGYQKRLSAMAAQDQEDIAWLLESIGKDLKGLEREFVDWSDKYDQLEDPFVKQYERLLNVFNEFRM